MVKLKRFQVGDRIFTNRWIDPFIVEVIYKGFVVAVNRRSTLYPVYLFIKTYSDEVYHGSSRFMKYGVSDGPTIKKFIDGVLKGDYVLDKDNCVPAGLLLKKSCFETFEIREQIKVTK